MNPNGGEGRGRRPSAVTIGNFDGVHRGHQALIGRAAVAARERGLTLVVVTFDPHPAFVLRGIRERFLLTPGSLKRDYLVKAGADEVMTLPFTPELRDMEPEAFLHQVLKEALAAQYVLVGYNFTFGRGGRGHVGLLENWGRQQGVAVEVMPSQTEGAEGRPISSSWIRELIRQGNLSAAVGLLGHPFSIQGVVEPGDQRGRALTVPTLNFEPPPTQVMPPYGVYAGFAKVSDRVSPAVANFGVRPTFGGGDPRWEVHVLEPVSWALYGETVQFDVVARIREERRFDSPDDLRRQIARDVEDARVLLGMRR
ncbi:MAG: riboflavin biosynthesis protein RibF [Firmicutes bacterium]|nr:riboflavin biosynthesis protein RibF [Bacillota bacterium]